MSTIIVKNLGNLTSKEDLRKHFKDCGEISKIILNKSRSNTFAEIVFIENKSTIQALRKDNSILKNSCIRVSIKKSLNQLKRKPFVNNNIESVDDKDSESASSDQEYLMFMKEYKDFFKNKLSTNKNNQSNFDVQAALGEAMNYYMNSNFDEAIKCLHEVIRISPNFPDPYHQLSLIYEKKGELKKALDFLMLSAQLSQGESEIWIRCAFLNKKLGNPQQAEYCITRALKIEKDNSFLLYERAVLQEEMGNLKKSVLTYEKILKNNNNSELLIYISNLYVKLNIPEKAIEVLEKYYEKSNRKYQVVLVLFNLYLSHEKYAQGIKFYEKFFLKDKNIHPPVDIKLRYLFFLLLEYQDPINGDQQSNKYVDEISKEIDNLDMNEHVEFINLLYDVFEKIDKFDKIFFIFEKFQEINDGSLIKPEIYIKIGEYFFNRNKEKSLNFYLKAFHFFPNDISIRLKLSELYKSTNQFTKAFEVLVVKSDLNDKTTEKKFIEVTSSKEKGMKNNIENQQEEFRFDYENNENFLNENNFNKEYLNLNNELNDLIENQDDFEKDQLNLNMNDEPFVGLKEMSEIEESHLFEKENLLSESIYMPGTSLLRKKRIKTTSNSKGNKRFENYLVKRGSKVLTQDYFSMNSIRLEFEEISNNSHLITNSYMKLQESLIYLQTKNFSNFLEITFDPLKKVLKNELRKEELKNRYFQNFLMKSNIRNYFKRDFKGSDGDEDRIIKDLNNSENDLGTNEGIFMRKSNQNTILLRKKVRKSMKFAEDEVNKIESLSKYITESNFINIIYNFIKLSSENGKYFQSNLITELILNSEKIKLKQNALNFNLYIFAIVNNFNLNNFKVSFYYLKKLLVLYGLKDCNKLWIYLWKTMKNVDNYSFIRSYIYKMNLNKAYQNSNLDMFLGNCYLKTGYYELSEKYYKMLRFTKCPLVFFNIFLGHLFKSFSRKNKNKTKSILKANKYLGYYSDLRKSQNNLEVLYNYGRFYQFIGFDKLALEYYESLMNQIRITNLNSMVENDFDMDSLFNASIYNNSLILRKNGSDDEAHSLLLDNIII